MGVTGVVVGSIMGLTTKLGSNVLQKVPYMRRTSSSLVSGSSDLLQRARSDDSNKLASRLSVAALDKRTSRLTVQYVCVCVFEQIRGSTCCSLAQVRTLATTSRTSTTRT